jgi:small subunit ribosomal protein S18
MSDEIIPQEAASTTEEQIVKESPAHPREPRSDSKYRSYGDREDGDGMRKAARFKRKSCRFCANKDLAIDYKDTELLGKFITDRGKILPRRITGNCAKHQRIVAKQIKRARIIALLPFVLK